MKFIIKRFKYQEIIEKNKISYKTNFEYSVIDILKEILKIYD